ncbi:whirlin-like [Liolophura sinensis]|uniref:whirlin-like n=1 Tax=Liolophura sinensis TaxID=3198878 RepID=UPI003158F919
MIRGNELFRVHVPQPAASEGFGFSIRGGCEYGIGIYISHVTDDGLASDKGLQAGDLILEVNDISFRKITHDEAAKIIRSARKLDLVICRVGRIPGSYSVHQSYIWVDPSGRPVSPPPELEQIGQARSGDQRRSGLMLLKAADERKINIFVEDEASLGLMIRGGREFGLGIYITGVDRNSVSHRAGLKMGDQILDINGQSFLDISHTEAVSILKDSSHMMMIIKDVGKIPYAKTTIDKTLWLSSDQIRRSHSNRELSNPYRETVGDTGKQPAFLRGAGSQLMLNSMATQQWDMIQERARQLLNSSEQETLRLHADDYQRWFIRVEELVLSLSDLLNTSAKFSLMTEIRNLVYPRDLDKYDALVMRREVEMIKNRQKYLAEDDRSSPESIEPDYSPLPSDRKFELNKHRHNSSPESSPEFSSVPHRRHDGKYSSHHGNQSQIYTSTGNITLLKKPPRHKLNAYSGDRLYYNTGGSFVDMPRSQKSRSGNDLRKARSEEQLLVMADVHDGLYSVAKPVEEMKNPAEGDSGVYMNGSSGSDSSSPSNK